MSEVAVKESLKVRYWCDKLGKNTSGSAFYAVRAQAAADEGRREQMTMPFPGTLAEKLLLRSKGKDINLYKLLLTGLHVLVSKYAPRPASLIAGSSLHIAGLEAAPEDAIVFFSFPYDEDDTVRSLMAAVHAELEEVLYHQDAGFQAWWAGESAAPRQELLRTGLFYEPLNRPHPLLDKVECLFGVDRQGEAFRLRIAYDPQLHTPQGVDLLGRHFFRMLELVAGNLDLPLRALRFVTDKDRELIFQVFNRTERPFPEQTVLDLFEAQAQATPDAIAIKSGGVVLTYRELDERANQIAHHLLEEHNLAKGEKVSLMVRRSERIALGILGILKAGGMYIPIDLSSPRDRVQFMLEDSESRVVLTQKDLIDTEEAGAGIRYVDIDSLCTGPASRPAVRLQPDDLVYMIYTSGTTGKPKGAMVYHRSLSNHVNWFRRQFALTGRDSTMLLNSYSFDGCYSYVWATLTSGGTLHLPTDEYFDPDQTLRYIKQEQVTFLKIVPSTFSMLINCPTFDEDPEACRSLRIIKQGGEMINVNNLRKYLAAYPDVLLGNHYGPTECTIGSVAHWFDKDTFEAFARQPVIGSPFDNQEILILDAGNEMLPIGVPGEICIGGAGVGKGYFKREELTARKFIDHPFRAGKKLYKTGDLGRWLPNGTIEFMGRIDNQVKIRGFRVELDEIAETLKTHPAIQEALVVLTSVDGEEALAAYLIAGGPLDLAEASRFLKERLPEYMAPQYFVPLERLPLTPNGKINRAALPAPQLAAAEPATPKAAPRTAQEARLLDIWRELLGKAEIGIHDNFFDIGGHSLRATQLVALVHKRLNVRLALREVFFHPTVAAMAALIEGKSDDGFTGIAPAPAREHYPLSHAQRRMWILSRMEKGQTAYNVPHAVTLTGELDPAAFARALAALVERHEILRTVFREHEGEPRQYILTPDAVDCRLLIDDLRAESSPRRLARGIAVAEATTVFDLARGPLVRARLIRLSDTEHIFLFTLHHIISDGWSTHVFANDILRLYDAFRQGEANPLPPLRIQYKDYTAWQHDQLNREQVQAHRDYWLTQFAGELPVLDLPTDYPRPKVMRFAGDNQRLLLNQSLLEKLHQLAREHQSSLFMVLLAAVKALLYRYTGQRDLIVGSPVAGREHADLRDQIGFYVNTLAFRSSIDGDRPFRELLAAVKETVLDAYQHQVYPFDQLIEDLAIERDTGRSPLFDVMVVLQNNETLNESLLEASNLRCTPYEYQTGEATTSKFDLTISFVEEEDGLAVGVEYRTDLFSPERMSRLLRHLQNVLAGVAGHPGVAVDAIPYLSPEEEHILLTEFAGHVRPVAKALTVPALFDRQVATAPGRVALTDASHTYTYRELADHADRVARHLRRQYGIGAEDVVAIVMDRSAAFVIAMLGILKCGAAYLPIEARTPLRRTLDLIDYTRARAVLCDGEERVRAFDEHLPAIDMLPLLDPGKAAEPADNTVDPGITAGSLAYIMFTSGSTGRPKGAMIEHRGIIRLVCDTNYVKLDEESRTLQAGSLSFDAATFEIWGPLLNGGQVHMADVYELLDARQLKAEIQARGITTMFITTSWFNQLVDQDPAVFQSMKEIIFGGEKASSGHVGKARRHCPGVRFVNAYGPTENTTFSICGEVPEKPGHDILLGVPIANSTVYILDANLRPVAAGITGEILLGGEGLGRGYIYDEERTRRQFIPHPFIPGERLYRSGDLGRWTSDGQVEFIGRVDDQVKIRGYRIEPGEVANVIREHEAVREAVVLVHTTGSGEKMLAACYTAGRDLPREEIRAYLSARLPAHMIPASLLQLPELPLNKNGKVDRAALPLPEIVMDGYVAPAGDREVTLVDLWSRVLNLPAASLSVEANFFELGGHSLKATALAGLVRQTFDVELPLAAIFANPTVRSLARHIDGQDKAAPDSIPAVEARPHYPLSPAQKRLYVLQQLAPESTAYNVPACFPLPAGFGPDRVLAVFRQLVDRHEILRTTFDVVSGVPVQVVHPAIDVVLEPCAGETPEAALAAFVRPFDLHRGPLFRIGYLAGAGGPVVLMDIHHSITDGLSQQIIKDELSRLAEGELLPAPRLQYRDYACWLESRALRRRYERDQAFWLRTLSGDLPVPELPVDTPRPEVRGFAGAAANFALTPEETAFLRELAGREEVTLYMLLLAMWTMLLARIGNQEDVIVGTPVSGRWHPDLDRLPGMFVNTLPMRNQPRSDLPVSDFLREVRENALAAFEHQAYPLEEMVEQVCPLRDAARNPLFDTMFSLLNREEFGLEAEIAPEEVEFSRDGAAKFDLNLRAADLGERLFFSLSYSTELFGEDTIRRLVGYFRQIIAALHEQPASELRLGDIRLLSPAEETHLLRTLNPGGFDFPADRTLTGLFERQVRNTPDRPALLFGDECLSYRELDERANQLAHFLRQVGVAPEQAVALCLERSPAMIIAMLGVLKAGGAYVPIDPDFPAPRIGFILRDTQATVAITSRACRDGLPAPASGDWIVWEEIQPAIAALPADPPPGSAAPGQLAYVIYTSGSTGQPKGVLIEHRSVVHEIAAQTRNFGIGEEDRILQVSNYVFDASVEQIFLALLNGAALVLIAKTTLLDPAAMMAYAVEQGVTYIHATPSLLQGIPPGAYGRLSRVLAGGEACPPALAEAWRPYVTFYNKYGPTETTINSLVCRITDETYHPRELPIGKPVGNTRIYILDKNRNLAPVGATGELYIGGPGVARGYLNRDDLTAERFIPSPFDAGERLYRTGDFARWTPGGDVLFRGRIDNQVKIRGYRVEPGEVENELLSSPGVRRCAVVAAAGPGGVHHLVAYIVPEGASSDKAAIRDYLLARLPDYLVPSLLIDVPVIPLTPGGKTDRKALPAPVFTSAAEEITAPATATEQALAAIWQEVLGLERVGADSNFFELGGHSLTAVKVINTIAQTMGVQVPLRELFRLPTIRRLSAYIDAQAKTRHERIRPVDPAPHYPLSHAQKRMWILANMNPDQSTYHIPYAVRLSGELNPAAFEQALATLVGRHEVLRTVFIDIDGEPRQQVLSPHDAGFQLRLQDLRQHDDPLRLAAGIAAAEAGAPFDLARGPLMRATLLQLAETDFVFLLTLHHIIFDGWSTQVLMSELAELYRAYAAGEANPLAPLGIQYRDYAVWQHDLLNGARGQAHRTYWLERFAGEAPVLELPTDYPRPKVMRFRGDTCEARLEKPLLDRLSDYARSRNASLYMLLVAAVKTLLFRYTGQRDLVVGSPVAGRDHADLANQIGFYVNTLALRSTIDSDLSFRAFLDEVKGTVLDAYEHQAFPFDRLIEELAVVRDTGRSPLFDVMVVLRNEERRESFADNALRLTPFTGDAAGRTATAKFDLTISFDEREDGLGLSINYRTDLFGAGRINRMLTHLQNILRQIAAHPETTLEAFSYLGDEESQLVLSDFTGQVRAVPAEHTVHGLFSARARMHPGKLALSDGRRSYTYRELDEHATRLARRLCSECAVRVEDVVAVVLPRGAEFVVAMLGVLKSGAAYLPIEAGTPAPRIAELLRHTQASVVIGEGPAPVLETGRPVRWIDINTVGEGDAGGSLPVVGASNLAYVMFTSGSTGRPKGVMIEHRGIIRLVQDARYMDFTEQDRVLQSGSLSFDAATFEIWGPLLHGGELHIVDLFSLLDARELKTLIWSKNITRMFFTTSWFNQLVDQDPSLFAPLRVVITGGEKASARHFRTFREHCPSVRLINAYGPTEITTIATCCEVTGVTSDDIPLGYPIDNTTVYILDGNLRPVPVGVPGELFLGGEGLSRGYIHDEERTRQRFVPNPYAPGTLFYRSGDRGSWREDGQVVFLGRVDDQVKIRGYRVEPGEIGAVLAGHEAVREAVVVAVAGAGGEKKLVAYYAADGAVDAAALKAYLTARLPVYMAPAALIALPALPLNKNGKVDRRRLPLPDLNADVYVAPAAGLEATLARLWAQVLNLPEGSLSAEANFFEVGGHSLKATMLAGLIRQELNAELPLATLFAHPTIKSLAAAMQAGENRRLLLPLNRVRGDAPRLYLIPPVVGSATVFQELAGRLGDAGIGCLGLQYRGFDYEEPFDDSIAAMADSMYREITRQPDLPAGAVINLLGYSMGAVIAFELAHRLEESGRRVRLILLDRSPDGGAFPDAPRSQDVDDDMLRELIGLHFRDAAPALPRRQEERLAGLLRHNLRLLETYRREASIRADILALEAARNRRAGHMRQWRAHTRGAVVHQVVAGDHFGLLDAAHLPALAAHVAGFIHTQPRPD